MSKLSASELQKINAADKEEQLAALKAALSKKDLEILDYKLKIIHQNAKMVEYEKALHRNELLATEANRETKADARRTLLKQYATKYKIKSDTWGYDPDTGEIITEES